MKGIESNRFESLISAAFNFGLSYLAAAHISLIINFQLIQNPLSDVEPSALLLPLLFMKIEKL